LTTKGLGELEVDRTPPSRIATFIEVIINWAVNYISRMPERMVLVERGGSSRESTSIYEVLTADTTKKVSLSS
jgi:hypothetical protein